MVMGCLTPATAEVPKVAEVAFEQHEIALGAAKHQTVLSGFFLGGPDLETAEMAEIAVVHVDENDDRRVQFYALRDDTDRQWVPKLDATLGRGVLFVEVANIGGRDRLITYEPGRLNWLDPDSGTERPLLEVAMDYNSRHDHEGSPTQPAGDPPHVDITRDLNRDGRDDLLVPDIDGFWISIQRSDGSFTEAVKLGPPEPFLDELVGNLNPGGGASDGSRTYRDVGITASTLPLYLSRVHEMDYDQDGRSDLVFWNKDHFDVHLQDENGLFAPVAETFVPDVPFDSEGVYSHAFEFRGQGVASILFGVGKKTKGTVLHSLRDLNGDGVADLVTLTLSGRSAAKQRSVYEVHFGTATADAPGGTVFAREVGTVIRPRGKGGAMQPWGYSVQRFEDLDGDGQVESLFREVTVGLGGIVRALVGNSVPINLELYRMQDSTYPDKPTFRRKIRRFAPFAGLGNVFFPPVLMGDVNGDGRSDLLVGKSPEELHVFLGAPGPDLLLRQPQKVAVALPSDERNTWLVDLNRDGKQDVLVHRGPTGHAPTEPHRVTTLIAR
jgi:hypothetical protein